MVVPPALQGAAMGDLSKRRGIIQANEAEGDDAVLGAAVPLAEMFGYSTALRSMTQVMSSRCEFNMTVNGTVLSVDVLRCRWRKRSATLPRCAP